MYENILVEPDKRLTIIYVKRTKDSFGGDLYTWTLKKFLADDDKILHLIVRAYNMEEMETQTMLIEALADPKDKLLADLVGRDVMSFRYVDNKEICSISYRKPDDDEEGKDLFLNENDKRTNKLKKALSFNIKIMNEKTFVKLLNSEYKRVFGKEWGK